MQSRAEQSKMNKFAMDIECYICDLSMRKIYCCEAKGSVN